MGWDSSREWTTKAKLVDAILTRELAPWTVLDHELKGSELWLAIEHPEGRKLCAVALLEPMGTEWGYKMLYETEGPYYYKCPARFLAMTDEPPAGTDAANWRAKMRKAA